MIKKQQMSKSFLQMHLTLVKPPLIGLVRQKLVVLLKWS